MGESSLHNDGRVALVKAATRRSGITESIAALGLNPVEGKEVMLKPNFNTADRYPGCTHTDTLRELIIRLQKMGARRITIGERSGPPNTAQVMEELGIFQLAEELEVDVLNFDELPAEQLVRVNPPESHWEEGFLVPRPLLEAECVVCTPCLKTHQFGGVFTMSLKLAVGIIPKENTDYMSQLHNSPYMREMIAEINAAYSPDLIVLDAMEAFVDGGPAKGTRKKAQVFLAGTDRIAIDAVGLAILKELGTTAEIMDRPIFEQEQIARAVQLGIGVSSPRQVEVVTDGSPDSEAYADKIRTILRQG